MMHYYINHGVKYVLDGCSMLAGMLFQLSWNIVPDDMEWGSILEVTIRFAIKFIVASGKTCLG